MIQQKDEVVEYSISPNSGRIRKKVRYRKKKSVFSKKKIKKYFEFGMLIALVVVLIVSVIHIMRPDGQQQNQMRVIDKKGKEK